MSWRNVSRYCFIKERFERAAKFVKNEDLRGGRPLETVQFVTCVSISFFVWLNFTDDVWLIRVPIIMLFCGTDHNVIYGFPF